MGRRESGIYRHGSAECELTPEDYGNAKRERPMYKLKATSKNLDDIRVIMHKVKTGAIRPEESYEGPQGGKTRGELEEENQLLAKALLQGGSLIEMWRGVAEAKAKTNEILETELAQAKFIIGEDQKLVNTQSETIENLQKEASELTQACKELEVVVAEMRSLLEEKRSVSNEKSAIIEKIVKEASGLCDELAKCREELAQAEQVRSDLALAQERVKVAYSLAASLEEEPWPFCTKESVAQRLTLVLNGRTENGVE